MPEQLAFNKDCMTGMKEFPDKHFDLAIVDPPYGIGISNIGQYSSVYNRFTSYKKKDWDNEVPKPEYFYELFRVSKTQIIWGGNYFELPLMYPWIIWDKLQPEGNDHGKYELAWNSTGIRGKIFKMSASWNNGGNSSDRQSKTAKARIHPTQKPTKLYKWLLKNYANEGDKILDTHLGSGSSRIAAYELGFSFTGYEIDPDYFASQEKRFKQHTSQTRLFHQKVA